MRKEFLVCLLVLIFVGITVSAEAQLFRRWGSPPVQQQQCPQQQRQQYQQQQYQQQLQQYQQQQQNQQQAFAQSQRQVEREQGPNGQLFQNPDNRNLVLVEVDSQGRVLRQLLDSQQLTRMLENRRLGEGRIAELLRQPQQPRSPGGANVAVVAPQPQNSVAPPAPPASQPQAVAVAPRRVSNQPVVTGYAVPRATTTFNPGVGPQVDIARQAVGALPTLAGPSVTATEPVVMAPAAPESAETVGLGETSLIEPAIETPPGSIKDLFLVPDSNVVPASATEDASGTVSILESSKNGISVLESQDIPGLGTGLLTDPKDN